MRTVIWDLECSNLRSDIGTLLVASFADLDAEGRVVRMRTQDINSAGGEKNLVKFVHDQVSGADILIGHNSVAFDRNYVNGVLTRHKMKRLPTRWHLDTMHIAKGKLLWQSVSLENLADVLGVGKKDKPSKNDWREANILDEAALKRLRTRCEADVRVTGAVFVALKDLWHERYGR